MKLLVDMNLSPRWIPFLRDAGWEATHWSTVGKAAAGDSEIMTFAATNGYVVLTNDLDFSPQKTKRGPDSRPRPEPRHNRQTNVTALQHVQKELEAGALLTIESDRTRLRMLPFEDEP